MDVAFAVDLLSDEPVGAKAAKLFYLTRESLKRRQIDELWRAKRATSPRSLAQLVCSEAVVDEVRKEMRRQTGHNAASDEVLALLRETVIRPELLG